MHVVYDVFVSFAGEDRNWVRALCNDLKNNGVHVWFDEFCINFGDSIPNMVNEGLRTSRYALAIMSEAFLENEWPRYEQQGFLVRQLTHGGKVLLPVLHNIT